jgi:hypothetical protein|tara:strand:- start:764 stop:1045 length:282 start_codon:yes stop_codon:yes gene_type:complete
MSMQTSADSAAGAPLWACAAAKLAPTSANRTNLFEDATADNFITGVTLGLFNYADGEVPAGAGHAGWNLKITGSGGRNGRVQYETLSVLTNAA